VLRAAAILFPLVLSAGVLRIEVKDPSGAAIEASGRLIGPVSIGFQTDANGIYSTTVPPGKYRVEIEKRGFATRILDLDVPADEPVSRTIKLALRATEYRIDVIAATPLPGSDLALHQIPLPVQMASKADLEKSGALDLADFMNRRLNGVQINEVQSNPFQPDLNYRGYTASPLLGTPEGISVYVDGVRQNQPFGDVVSWDLIPRNAIETVELMPGSDPLFGLNTLGGALSVQTRSGLTSSGLAARVTYGSSGRKGVEAEYGGANRGFNYYFAANALHESGWRFDSPSNLRQAFIRLGWRDFALTTTYAYNTLTGNGLQDYRLLAQNYSSVYTIPDTTGNRSPSFGFIANHAFSSTLTVSGNAWFRNIRTEGVNGNANTDSLTQNIYQPNARERAALTAAGYTGFPSSGANASNTPFPYWPCIAETLLAGDTDSKCDAITIYSKEVQNDFGASGQIVKRSGANRFLAGAAFDRGSVGFTQNTKYGYLNPDRSITGVAAFDDASRVNLHGSTPNWSLFAADTVSIGSQWSITLSGRFNRSTIDNSDRINPIAGPGSLAGNYVFQRFNPSAGVTYHPSKFLTAFANFAQSSRAPTSIELGCADPNNPCSLPNALASDPPLKQVVASTWEVGARGDLERDVRWAVNGFRAVNRDDILFLASAQLGTGYFQNFGKTEREGVQASVDAHLGRFTIGADYTFLNATYQVATTLAGGVAIRPGNRIPLIPKHSGKAFLDVQTTRKLVLNAGLVVNSSSYARGNEDNAYQPDGATSFGPGVSPGYAVFNAQARYDLTKRWQLGIEADNLFDRHYYTAAQLATTAFTPQGTVLANPNAPPPSVTFFSPGALRRAWVELRFRW